MPKLVKSDELSAMIDMPVSLIRKLSRKNQIPSILLGSRVRLYDPEKVMLAILDREQPVVK